MTKDNIITLLKRKKVEVLQDKDTAIEKHDHNSAYIAEYFSGKAAGITTALEIIGMFNTDNAIGEFIDRTLEWLENNLCCYIVAQDFAIEHERLEKDFRKFMEEQV